MSKNKKEMHLHIDFGFSTDAFVYWMNNVKFSKGKKVARLIEVPKVLSKKTILF